MPVPPSTPTSIGCIVSFLNSEQIASDPLIQPYSFNELSLWDSFLRCVCDVNRAGTEQEWPSPCAAECRNVRGVGHHRRLKPIQTSQADGRNTKHLVCFRKVFHGSFYRMTCRVAVVH